MEHIGEIALLSPDNIAQLVQQRIGGRRPAGPFHIGNVPLRRKPPGFVSPGTDQGGYGGSRKRSFRLISHAPSQRSIKYLRLGCAIIGIIEIAVLIKRPLRA